jgi:hypothetical protein
MHAAGSSQKGGYLLRLNKCTAFEETESKVIRLQRLATGLCPEPITVYIPTQLFL